MANMINISPSLSTFSSKCAQNKGNINQVAFTVVNLRFGEVPISPQMIDDWHD